jgi:dextranase
VLSELLPVKATFAPGDPIEIEVRGVTEAALWHLERKIAEASSRDGVVRFDPQPEGGYGVEGAGVRTAVDVLSEPLSRPRYGFVSDYSPGREVAGVSDAVRRLHLNAVQFYDWMYRHASLLPPQNEFEDPLGRRLSLDTVRRLAAAVRAAGSLPLGYAAVYAAGRDEWPAWAEDGLYRADGTPWTLGDDFLWNVDPSSERWLQHLAADLEAARVAVGFAGFHLDQYGAPKRALRRDGAEVDLAVAFPVLIDRLADELPEARLIFNNVNDFPTWATAGARQHAVYIEVWPPHERLGHLAELVRKARALAPGKGVVLAAYLSVYSGDDEAVASAAERLQLATVFSHGGSCLLHGEEDAVITEAYYVRHGRVTAPSLAAACAYYDFAVRYGDLLFDARGVDVTRTELGGVNEELRIEAPVPVSTDCAAGVLWARAIRSPRGLILSLIDLSQQTDDLWDAPKQPSRPLAGVRLAVERSRSIAPPFRFAAPEDSPALQTLRSVPSGRYDAVEVPPFRTWALVWVCDEESA